MIRAAVFATSPPSTIDTFARQSMFSPAVPDDAFATNLERNLAVRAARRSDRCADVHRRAVATLITDTTRLIASSRLNRCNSDRDSGIVRGHRSCAPQRNGRRRLQRGRPAAYSFAFLAAHFAALPTSSTHTHIDPRSDEALLVAHRGGEAEALRALIERYKGELHGFLTRLVGTRTGADDVFQEAFLQVHLSAESFDEERRFKPWLYTIAANKGRDFLRRQKRRAAVSLDAPIGASGEASLIDLLGDGSAAPSSSLESSDEASIVKVVVDGLPSHFREILLLAYFQKMSYAQISDSLAIPLGTVKSRLHASVACFAESWKLACSRRDGRSSGSTVPAAVPSRSASREVRKGGA